MKKEQLKKVKESLKNLNGYLEEVKSEEYTGLRIISNSFFTTPELNRIVRIVQDNELLWIAGARGYQPYFLIY